MARTGQPAVRHVAAVERAFTVLDALADGGRSSARTRSPVARASTPARCRACSRRSPRRGSSSTSPETGALSAVAAPGRARQRRARAPRPPRCSPGRTCRPSCGRPARRQPCRPPASTMRSPSTSRTAPPSSRAWPSSAGPSVGHATAVGKVMLAFGDVELPAEPLASFTPRTITTRANGSSRSSSGYAGAVTPRRGRSARKASLRSPPPCWDSRGDLVGIVGVQGPASRFDPRAMRAAVPLLLEHAGAISAALGWPAS